jgi:hypothetical protein
VKKPFLFSIFILIGLVGKAQELELTIGDTIEIGTCTDKNSYRFIDLYRKTRIEDTTATYDTLGGSNFYTWFFKTGDFDASRLPCSNSGRKVILAAAQYFTMKEGEEPVLVLMAWLDQKKLEVVWIMTYDAIDAGEIKMKSIKK